MTPPVSPALLATQPVDLMAKGALVPSAAPGAVATSVTPLPGRSIDRSPNVATPAVALTVSVPDSVADDGLAPSATVIGTLVVVTGAPPASTTVTRTGASAVLASASMGCVVNDSVEPAGGGTSGASVSGKRVVADGLTSTSPAALPMACPSPSSATMATWIVVFTLASKRRENVYAGGIVAPTGTVIVSLCPLPSAGVTDKVAIGPTGADASPSSTTVTMLLPGAQPASAASASATTNERVIAGSRRTCSPATRRPSVSSPPPRWR